MAWFNKKDPPPARPAGGQVDGKVNLPPLSTSLTADERAFLVTCCDTATPAVVTWPDLAVVRRAVFRRVDRDSLYMQIADHGGTPYRYRHLTQCVVSFFFANRVATFAGYEEACGQPAGSPDTLILSMPTQVAFEGRTRFRIPILASLAMECVVVLAAGRQRSSRPVDINVAGMMLAFKPAQEPGLQVDQVVRLALEAEGRRCEVPATVRHREVTPEEILYGFLFHNGTNGWEYPQDRELAELVAAVERYWARNSTR